MTMWRNIIFVLIFAFVLNVSAPFYYFYDDNKLNEEQKIALAMGDIILICSIDGPKLIDLQTGEESQIPGNNMVDCPLCTVTGSDEQYSLIPQLVSVEKMTVVSKLRYRVSGHLSISYSISFIHNPRAPPHRFVA